MWGRPVTLQFGQQSWGGSWDDSYEAPIVKNFEPWNLWWPNFDGFYWCLAVELNSTNLLSLCCTGILAVFKAPMSSNSDHF